MQASVRKHYGDTAVGDSVVDTVMAIADIHSTGGISPLEMIIVYLVATDLITPRSMDDQQLAQTTRQTAAHM
jgi:hypothetical protein